MKDMCVIAEQEQEQGRTYDDTCTELVANFEGCPNLLVYILRANP